ncbi:MAG: Gmad2 immunoglobulin-like domain-containing protein [Patescibacteria group bacterium]
MSTRTGIIVGIVLFFVIIAAGWVLVATPAPAISPTPTPTPPPSGPFISEMVKITSPLAGATVGNTFTVKGEARGQWYFEASFPVQVKDKDNNTVGQGIAQAQGEWMTTEFVPFTANVIVTNYSGPATLVLLKDNPSGLPENDDAVSIPIIVQ